MIEYIINMQNAAVGYTLLLLLILITLSEVPQSSRQCWYLHKSYYAAESCDKIPRIALSLYHEAHTKTNFQLETCTVIYVIACN